MTRLYLNESKYRSQKAEVDGIVFDSKREANRYTELKLLEKAGKIKNLELQKEYMLIPKQTELVNGRMRVIEKECTYKADFTYEEDGKTIVEDTKGFRTKDYIIKRKLMLYLHDIKIREI